MKRFLATFGAPAYLLLCIVFGGSQQGIWANAALQVIAIGLLIWISLSRAKPLLTRSFNVITGFASLTLVLIALQLVPLPPGLWSSLAGRELLVAGYRTLELQLPWLPLSQTPHATVVAALALLPPLALFASVQLQDDPKILAGTLVVGTVAAIVLGQLQVGVRDNQWQFYEITNAGPVGFFANLNHMATLLLASIPFAVALLIGQTKHRHSTYGGVQVGLVGVVMALLFIGVILNGSLAALLLSGPVLLASGLQLPIGWRLRMFVLPFAGLALLGAVYALSADPLERATGSEVASVESRQQIWATTVRAIDDSFPFGTGLGSFESVYRQYEDQSSVSATYVNHAHNDYLQVVLELGAAGIILMVLFLVWWASKSWRIWQSAESTALQRAATIASAAILAHSVVDYPLRTAAIAAVFGMSIGLVVRPPRRSGRNARHLRIAN